MVQKRRGRVGDGGKQVRIPRLDRIPLRDVFPPHIRGVQTSHTIHLGRTAVNPNIDDNRCLQQCLILVSESGHKIVTNRKMGDETVYNKW